jgi:CheY-like chemotaxis protein
MPLSVDIDIVLLDMSLPIVDKWTAASILKGEQAIRVPPIIALTTHAMAGDREKALAAGCDDYDTKPVEFRRLLGKINAFVDQEEK